MVELIVLSVVVGALLIAAVWYLLVRRGSAERARRVASDDAVVIEAPTVAHEESSAATLAEPVEAPEETLAELVEAPATLRQAQGSSGVAQGSSVLSEAAVLLDGSARTKEDAVREAGELLVAIGAVEPAYVDAMLTREKSVSTYMGNLLAIPHGTYESRDLIRRSAISLVRYPQGIDWNGNRAQFVVGIAGANDDHVHILSNIAGVFLNGEAVDRLQQADSAADVLETFAALDQAD